MTLTEAAHVQIDSEAREGWDWGGRISPSITNITTPHPLLAPSIIDYTIPPVTANQLILVSFIIQQDQPAAALLASIQWDLISSIISLSLSQT